MRKMALARVAGCFLWLAAGVQLPAQAPEQLLPPGTGAIVGRVLETGSDQPVPGAMVNLTGYLDSEGQLSSPALVLTEARFARSVTKHVVTSAEGYFVFQGLPTGRYTLTADALGYELPLYEPRLVQLDRSETPLAVTLHLWRYGSISGRVFDELGEPVVGAPVTVLRQMRGGRSPALRTLRKAVLTDDRGVYRIADLPPDSYVVGALSTPTSLPASVGDDLQASAARGVIASPLWITLRDSGGSDIRNGEGIRIGNTVLQQLGPPAVLDPNGALLMYPATFYPGTNSGTNAELITIGSGESRSGIDLPVSYSTTVRVSGSVTGPDGPVPNVVVRLLPPDSTTALAAAVPSSIAATDGDGSFTFLGVSPGQYMMSIMSLTVRSNAGYDAPDDSLWALQRLAVGDTDVTGLHVGLSPGIRVSGRVVFSNASGQTLSEDQQVLVSLRPFGTGTSGKIALSSTALSDGSFATDAVPPGQYQIRFSIICVSPVACPTNWKWQSTSVGGDQMPYDVLELTTTDLTAVVATFSEGSTYLSGSIVDAAGVPDSDTHVIVFPADTMLWRDDVFDRRIRRVHADVQASFDIEGLPPGDYHVAAVKAPYPNNDPRNLERLVPLATTVTLREAEHTTVHLETVAARIR